MRTWLTTPKADFQNVTIALRELEHLLGTDVEILTKLPKRLKLGPEHRPRNGDRHKPHQICGLFFTIWMEYTLGVFILADGCGVGETHALMSHVIAAEKMWAKKGEPVTRPTLVLCPRTLLSKTLEDLQNQLGAEWRVAKYGEKLTSTSERIVFDPRHPVYNFKNAGKTIVVCSISQLQNCTLSEESNRARNGLFARILIDKAQCVRRCDQAKQGAILKSFNADYRGLFTGSPVVDTLGDLDWYLAFLEKPEWSDDVDLNVAFDDEARSSRYTRFLAKQDGARLQAGEEEAELEGWASDCDSINDLDDDQIQAKLGFGWRKTRRPRKNLQASQPMVDPPFEQNPFDLYHPDNRSSIKCCTTRAFRYYIVPHLKPGRVEEDRELIARRVRLILDRLVLGRSLYSETIDEQGNKVKVDADLSPVSIETQELRLAMDEAAAYQMRESKCGSVLLSELTPEMLKEVEDNPKKGNGSTFAKVSTLCTHIGLSGLQKVSTAVSRARRAEGLPVLVARMKQAGSLNPADKDVPLDSPEEVLRQFLWGSPKFRFALQEVQRVILGSERPETHRKLLVFFQFPRSAEIFLKMMEYVGIRCVLLDMAMSADDRLKNIRAFDSLDDPLILISTYPLNIAGHDLQHRCANVLHVEPAFNWATEYQAQSRVFRIGQTVPVEIVRLFTEGTYQELHEYAMLQKANSMFTAFKALKEAVPHGIAASATTTREELAMSAFGICHRRVKELVDRAAAKKEAKDRADAAATGDLV